MEILILNGSPRNANTTALVNAFKEGAESKGHAVKIHQVGKMKINGCLGCEYCHTKGAGECIQKDDMTPIYDDLKIAEMIVFASPVYFHSFTGQLQSALTRIYAINKPPMAKESAMILSAGGSDICESMEMQYKRIIRYFATEDMGVKKIAGDIIDNADVLEEMKNFGKSL